MICTYNDPQCESQGYCNCLPHSTRDIAESGGSLLWMAFAGIFTAFLYPSIRILRSEPSYQRVLLRAAETDETGGSWQEDTSVPEFAGTKWLMLSPVFGLLSNTLYQIVFAFGACAAGTLENKLTSYVYASGVYLIYALAMGLALVAYIFKNKKAVALFIKYSETRTVQKIGALAGVLVVGVLTCAAIISAFSMAVSGYNANQAEKASHIDRQQKMLDDEILKLNRYIGRYRLKTHSEKAVFSIAKDVSGKALRLSIEESNSSNNTKQGGCLLTPKVERQGIFYQVTDCLVDGQKSPLETVYFTEPESRLNMHFIYSVRASGDSLEKIN